MSVPRDAFTFGSLLREHRRAVGLTQEALADRSGVSTRSNSRLTSVAAPIDRQAGMRPRS
jgi:transcriptional regulator with XRE-family HTH domain